eukprot:m.94726 g.94726  ORF g.94726 m.94726 type:complete len:334 (-) comp26751_c1_seq1:123-1124(-)
MMVATEQAATIATPNEMETKKNKVMADTTETQESPTKKPRLDTETKEMLSDAVKTTDNETSETETATPPSSSISDESTGVMFEGKELEVLWNLVNLEVWWDCTAVYANKQDRKGRHIYNLMYNAKPELKYGEEKRPVVFTAEGLLRDQLEKQMMQYRWAGDTKIPQRLFLNKECVIVQSDDDEREWQSALVDHCQEDGTYTVLVGKQKIPDVNVSRIEVATIPTSFPPEKTKKYTSRFFEKVISQYLGMYTYEKEGTQTSLTSSQKKSIKIDSQVYKSQITSLLEEEIGDQESLADYDTAMSEIDVPVFVSKHGEAILSIFGPLIDKKIWSVK